MKSALQNLLSVLVLVIGLGFFGWVYLRHDEGLMDHKVPLDHAFLRESKQDVVAYHVAPPPSEKPYSPLHLDSLNRLAASTVIWLEVRERMDGTIVAAETDTAVADAPALEQVINGLGQHRLILNFRGNRPGSHEKIGKIVEAAKAADRVLVQSPEDGFLKDMRAAKPLFLFGTSLAQVTRLIMMSSIGLTGLSPIKGDVVVIESQAKEHLVERLSESLIADIQRRKMKIYAGPASLDESLQLWARGISGVLTSQPQELTERLVNSVNKVNK